MNTKILQKCLDELKKEQPNVDYIRGMLETLVEMGDTAPVVVRTVVAAAGGESRPAFSEVVEEKTAPVVVKHDPAGEMETPEQRKVRLGQGKVPPAFLGDIRRMNLDPAKTDGKTDVTLHM